MGAIQQCVDWARTMEAVRSSPLGDLLLRTRKRADLTQEALAERAGVSVNTISNLEAGRGHLPRQGTLDLLVNALAVALMLAPAEQARLMTACREAARATRARREAATTHPAEAPLPLPPTMPSSGILTFLICTPVTEAEQTPARLEARRASLSQIAARLERCVPRRQGRVVDPPDGADGAVVVFAQAEAALAAATALQQALGDTAEGTQARLALHSGWAAPGTGEYAGPTRRRATRLARLAHPGQVLLSQSSRDLLARTLPEGMRLREAGRHSLCPSERPGLVYQLSRPDMPTPFPPLRPPEWPPTNVPVQVTSFVGREREQVALEALLAQAALVTLTGTGGCGKSRLALQMAADLLETFPEGVWLVELAPLSNPALVPHAVAAVLNVHEEPGRPLLETLLDALAPRRALLVLDNCEHLLAACGDLVSALLRRCPYLQILATSRERLAIRGEITYRVPSLSLPERDSPSSLTSLAASEAVRLFVERAGAALPTFALTNENATAVAHLCARLDGIPLAIELAAAHVAGVELETILTQLEQSIGALGEGPRDLPSRHKTLRATLDWSWALLAEMEQTLLARLAVFAGGWRLGAAVAVCAGDGLADWAVPDLLEGLGQKSLVARDEREEGGRFRLLETVRAYAAERLAEAGEQAVPRDRHLSWCVALAEEAEGQLKGPEQGAWLARLEREHDNLRAALGWASERAAHEEGMRLAGAIWRFWRQRGHMSEGRAWLQAALADARSAAAPARVRARALNAAGILAYCQGDYQRATALQDEALPLWRALGDKEGLAGSLNNRGIVAMEQGDYSRSMVLLEEALALRRELGDTWAVAHVLCNLGNVVKYLRLYERAGALYEEALMLQRDLKDKSGIAATLINLGNLAGRQGDDARAELLYEESLSLHRELEDRYGVAFALGGLGRLAYKQEAYERAAALHEECLAIQRAVGDTAGIASSLGHLGQIAERQRDYGRAAALHEEATALRRKQGDRPGLARSLLDQGLVSYRQVEYARAIVLIEESLRLAHTLSDRDLLASGIEIAAWVTVARNEARKAALLSGFAQALREALDLPLSPPERTDHDRAVRAMRAALGEAAYAAAWAEGQALQYAQAVALALDGSNRLPEQITSQTKA